MCKVERLKINSSILRYILDDREATDELREFLNSVIDDELSKNENADCDLIDECINALEELDSENPLESPRLTVLTSEEKFLKSIQKKSRLQKNKYQKLAVICASAILLFALGSVKTESGQTVAKSVAKKIAAVFNIKNLGDSEGETSAPETEPQITEPASISDTSQEALTEVSSEQQIDMTTPKTAAPVLFEKIRGVLSEKAKTEYKIGDKLDTDGVQIFAVYSDGSEKQIPIDKCSVSVPQNFAKDAGRYKITVTYREKSFSYDVKVYAEKESVILNSIYGTFPNDYDFTVESFDDIDLTGMTVTAVYSDGSEKNIPLEECEINVEKNFMEIENKALITVTYEERQFSFVLTKEEK